MAISALRTFNNRHNDLVFNESTVRFWKKLVNEKGGGSVDQAVAKDLFSDKRGRPNTITEDLF